MPYTPLTKEQFEKARSSGFSPEEIIEMEKQRKEKESQPADTTINKTEDKPKASLFSRISGAMSNPELGMDIVKGFGKRMLSPVPSQIITPKSTQDGSETPPIEKEEGLSSTLAKGVADIALQPARFLERAGKAIGTIGLDEEGKQKMEDFWGEGLQEQIGGEEYATPAYTSAKQAGGGAILAAANLATPMVGGVGALVKQGAALGLGKSLEDDESWGRALFSGAIGAGTSFLAGKASTVLGQGIAKGYNAAKQELIATMKPIAKKLAPALTGLTKGETNIAFNKLPEVTLRKLKIIANTENPADAQALLRADLLKSLKGVVGEAKEVAEKEFDDALKTVYKKYPDARGDVPAIARQIQEELPKFGKVIKDSDSEKALQTVMETLREPMEYTFDGMRRLSNDLWSIVEQTEQGTPARKAATSAWGEVRKEISRMTKGDIDPAMAKYSLFKDDMLELKPVWSEKVTEDSARNFANNLESAAKTGSRDALKRLEALAGLKGSATDEITINRLVKYLSKDNKVTGSRVMDILIAGGAITGGGGIGEMIGGEKGRGVGQVAGVLLGGKVLAPKVLSKILLSGTDDAGIKMTSPIRQKIGEIFQDPKFLQVLQRLIQGGPKE